MFTDFSEQTAFPLLVHLVYLLTHKEHKMTQPYPVWRDMAYGVTCVLDHCYLSLIRCGRRLYVEFERDYKTFVRRKYSLTNLKGLIMTWDG